MQLFKTCVIALLSFLLSGAPALASFTQSDVTNLNNAEPPSKYNRTFGYRHGSGKCVFDTATTANRTIDAHTCNLIIPKDAVVKFAAYKVLTTFTSASDAATIAISVVAANDVVSAAAISTGTTWDAASIPIETIPKVETSTTWLVTTVPSAVTFTVAIEALTAGKMVVWFEWLYFGDA
jgi:hypothetical protein